MSTQFLDNPPFRWKTIKVFISSTFRDFHAERDYLVKNVFPELREWCQKWKLHLVDIDLRWGVTQSEAESGKVVDICLEQIDGARPFFLCMLGNRYGWVPKAGDVPAETYRHYDRLGKKEGYSVTHLEIEHAVLDPLSSLDANEEVPHAFFYLRDENSTPKPETIADFNDDLRKEYRKTFFETDAALTDRLKSMKKDISAHYAAMGQKNNNPQIVSERIFDYHPQFVATLANPEDDKLKGRFTAESLRDFGERVKSDLKRGISLQFEQRITALSEKREDNWLEEEQDFQESFVEGRTRLFVGRTELLKKLNDYVNSDSKQILAVYGEPGSGKSALLSQFYSQLTETSSSNPEPVNPELVTRLIIPHFIGASPQSTAIYALLRRVCELILNKQLQPLLEKELETITGSGEEPSKKRDEVKKKYEVPFETNRLHECFWRFMEMATAPIVIIFDGLNQLDEIEDAHSLYWLPNELPEKVKIIATTLSGDTKEALERKTELSMRITQLSDDERKEIVKRMPSVFCKSLDDSHIDLLLTKEETRNPLYLKVALDELRVFGSFDKLETAIAAMPNNVVDLFHHVLDRIESEHGEQLVERLFCLLVCSRYGLTQKELKDLMAELDPDNRHILILRQIRDYLVYREDLIDFFHRALAKAIRKKYFAETGEEEKVQSSELVSSGL
jgi:nephrocystin-3